jgi:predicted secreted protein
MWTKTFGDVYQDQGTSVIETTDGGFIITGVTGLGFYDLGLLKTDSNGNLIWLKTFGGLEFDVGYKVSQTLDGGYIVVGYTSSYGAGSADVWVIKVDSNGNQQWAKTFGGTNFDAGLSVKQLPNEGYIVAGYTESYGAGASDVWLIKLDQNGNQQWAKTYGGTGNDYGCSVELSVDGGFIVTGYQESFSNGGYDVGLLKTDSDGNLIWLKNFGGTDYDGGYSIKRTIDGGFIITGLTKSSGAGGRDVWVIKTNSDGNQQWAKTYGGIEDDEGRSIDQTTDGGFVIAGITKSFGAGNEDVGLLKIDGDGDLLWITSFGGFNDDRGHSVRLTSDDGYIVTGNTYSYGAGLSDVWLIKVKPDISEVISEKLNSSFDLNQNYPNPFNPRTKIKYSIPNTSYVLIKIYDILGNKIETLVNEEKPTGTYEITWNAENLPSGVYFYRLNVNNYSSVKKMILLK